MVTGSGLKHRAAGDAAPTLEKRKKALFIIGCDDSKNSSLMALLGWAELPEISTE